MKKFEKWIKNKWVGYTLVACIAVAFYTILNNIENISNWASGFMIFVRPVINGIIIAYILNPLCIFLEHKTFKRISNNNTKWTLSVICTIILIFFVIVLLSIALIPQIMQSVHTLFLNMDTYLTTFQGLLQKVTNTSTSRFIGLDLETIFDLGDDMIEKASVYVTDNMSLVVNKSAGFGKWIAETLMSIILAIYFLVDKYKIQHACSEFLSLIMSEENYQSTIAFLTKCNNITFRFISVEIMDGVIVGLANYIFMMATGLNYAALISIIVGITNLAPTFGPIVGGLIGSFILVLINPWHALLFLIFTIILQTIDGYVLKPKLFGNSLGISSLAIIIAIILGGRLLGVTGILLAIPVAAIVDFTWKDFIMEHLRKRQQKHNAKKLQTDNAISEVEVQEKSPEPNQTLNTSAGTCISELLDN